jgi:hypothetical protein
MVSQGRKERFTSNLGNTYTAIVCAAHCLSTAVAAKNVGQCAAQAEQTTIAAVLICVGRAAGLREKYLVSLKF